MKVVVFGGGGFIGSAIVRKLLLDKHHVVIFENKDNPEINNSVEWVNGDYKNLGEIKKVIKGADVVIYLISTILPSSSIDNLERDVVDNVIPMIGVLNAMREERIPKLIFISSGGTVYGNSNSDLIDEGHQTNPIVPYGITKLMIEKYINFFEISYGIKSIILRVSNPYGLGQNLKINQGVVGVFINKLMNNENIEIWGDGTVVRDYIHVNDVADAFIKALTYEGDKRIFNISSSKGYSLLNLISLIEKNLNAKAVVKFYESRKFDVQCCVLNNSLAISELNWMPNYELNNGIEELIAKIKNDY